MITEIRGQVLTNFALMYGVKRRLRRWYWPFVEGDESLRKRAAEVYGRGVKP